VFYYTEWLQFLWFSKLALSVEEFVTDLTSQLRKEINLFSVAYLGSVAPGSSNNNDRPLTNIMNQIRALFYINQ